MTNILQKNNRETVRSVEAIYFSFGKKDKIKMCKNCSGFYCNGLWHDKAPENFAGRLSRESAIELTRCPMCVYLRYKEQCLICQNSNEKSPCLSCLYLYYKANQSMGITAS